MQAAAEAAAKQNQLDLAGQQFDLTREQMFVQMNQRKIESLSEELQKPKEVRVLTMPSQEPQYSMAQKINIAIDNMLRGSA